MNEMDKLVEAVARAIREAPLRAFGVTPDPEQPLDEGELRAARAALAAIHAQGVALVPVELTEEMRVAAREESVLVGCCNAGPEEAAEVLSVLLAASPYRAAMGTSSASPGG